MLEFIEGAQGTGTGSFLMWDGQPSSRIHVLLPSYTFKHHSVDESSPHGETHYGQLLNASGSVLLIITSNLHSFMAQLYPK